MYVATGGAPHQGASTVMLPEAKRVYYKFNFVHACNEQLHTVV